MRSRVPRAFFALVVALSAVWGASTVLENQRRDSAVRTFLAEVALAPDGSDIDLANAFDLEWDRAVVVGPYWFGENANEALGFEHYPKNDVITEGDGTYLLVFVRDREVVAEVPLYGQAFYFDESIASFTSDDAHFRVQNDATGVVLSRAPVLVVHNRSDVPIALYPGVTVGPCSVLELDEAAIEQGMARLDQALGEWVPAGARRLGGVIHGQPTGSGEPITVVISGRARALLVEHRLSPADLPPCGGQPVGLG